MSTIFLKVYETSHNVGAIDRLPNTCRGQ